ncbi:MAG: T9SS type A sorting domain-containing protein [Rhodobiaceae bacterium]|nr:T9SS type A sorting domain-containing protein [Rhodobiaceae bacterium]
MLKSILIRFTLCIAVFGSISKLSAADTTLIAHSATPGAWESFIMADTANGMYNADVYVLESNKIHYQVSTLELKSSVEIIGAPYADGEFPATIQQIPNSAGASGFIDGWLTSSSILFNGVNQKFKLHNLLFNGMRADGATSTWGVLVTSGEGNHITVDHVTSVHHGVITYLNVAKGETWRLTNNTAVQYTSYAGGMYFGGFFWGGGGWGGSLKSAVIQNNTIEGVHGNPIVFWVGQGAGESDAGNALHVDHNTFVNTIDAVRFPLLGNNGHFTNNLFVNAQTNGQTKNHSNTNIALNHDGGVGKMVTRYQAPLSDSAATAQGWAYDNTARNIHFANNVWHDTPELLDLMAWNGIDGWCWNVQGASGDSLDADGNNVTLCDTMLAVADQSKWMDDSTAAQAVNGVTEMNNVKADANFGWALSNVYINAQIVRTKDWLDNGAHNTHTTPAWLHQTDNSPTAVEWPLVMDFSYATTSNAYTAAEHGYPAGDLNAFPSKKTEWMAAMLSTDLADVNVTPSKFVLAQNHPNPFNPTTEIAFTLDQRANVNLSIYNMLGQKVKTLASEFKNAGTHTLQWNGRDEMGQNVSTGVYLYTLTSGSESITKKMAFMK